MTSEKKIGLQEYYLFIVVFYIWILRDMLERFIPSIKYLDELYALLAVAVFMIELRKNRGRIKLQKYSLTMWLGLFCISGIIASLVYQYQSVVNVMFPDLFLNIKFWLAIYVSSILFKSIDIETYGKRIGKHIKVVIYMWLIMIAVDMFFLELFPGEIRYGFKCMQLFYGHPAAFCAVCAFLLALLCIVKKKVKNAKVYMVILCLLMVSTMRSKAFGSVILFLIMYYIIIGFNKKINVRTLVVIGLGCMVMAWSRIQYFFLGAEYARRVLLRTSLVIAKEHFPLGAGFGTFASYYSGLVYSPLYYQYGVDKIHGLGREQGSFISDSFWPMLLAQTGFLGTFFYGMALFLLFRWMQKIKIIDRDKYFAALYILGYLLISSVAEAAFVHPIAIPCAMVIGICLSNSNNSSELG